MINKIGTQEYNPGGTGTQPMNFPANSEEFYRKTNQSSQSIIDRIKANATEQQTYLNSVNHEMDEIGARTTANGGVLSADDAKRYRDLKNQLTTVMGAFSGPESKGFQDAMWFARDRAQKSNPNGLDFLPMSAEQAMTHTRNNRPAQEEYLVDVDAELQRLQQEVDSRQAGEGTRRSYEYLEAQMRKMRDANSEQTFDDELTARIDQAMAGKNAIRRTES